MLGFLRGLEMRLELIVIHLFFITILIKDLVEGGILIVGDNFAFIFLRIKIFEELCTK